MTIEEKREALNRYCAHHICDNCVLQDTEDVYCYSNCTDAEIERHYTLVFPEDRHLDDLIIMGKCGGCDWCVCPYEGPLYHCRNSQGLCRNVDPERDYCSAFTPRKEEVFSCNSDPTPISKPE